MAGDLLARVTAWCDEWIKPVLGTVYERDLEEGQRRLAIAREHLDPHDFSLDELTAIELFITRAENYLGRLEAYPDRIAELFERITARYREIGHCGPASEFMFHRVMLDIKVSADRDGVVALSNEEFHGHFDSIPGELRSAQVWYAISPWLFTHGKLSELEEGYAVLLTSPVHLQQYPFRRMKLMCQLLGGTCREDDVIYYLQHLEIHNAFNEFMWFFKDPVAECGLLTEAVEEQIKLTKQRLEKSAPQNPFKG